MKILVFGDSIAVGAFDTENNGWVSLLAMHQYKRILDTDWKEGDSVMNASIEGDTTLNLLQRIESDIESGRWEDEVFASVLAIGTNDAAILRGEQQVGFETFSANVQKILDILLARSRQIIVLGLLPVYEKLSSPWCYDEVISWQNDSLEKYDAELQRLANEKKVLFVPMLDVLDRNSDAHLPEGVHPNAEGHRLIYERVKEVLEKEDIL